MNYKHVSIAISRILLYLHHQIFYGDLHRQLLSNGESQQLYYGFMLLLQPNNMIRVGKIISTHEKIVPVMYTCLSLEADEENGCTLLDVRISRL